MKRIDAKDYYFTLIKNGRPEGEAFIDSGRLSNMTRRKLSYQQMEYLLYPYHVDRMMDWFGFLQSEVAEILEISKKDAEWLSADQQAYIARKHGGKLMKTFFMTEYADKERSGRHRLVK